MLNTSSAAKPFNFVLIKGETQTAYLLALRFELLPANLRPLATRHLADDIEAKNDHLSTGFIGVGYLCPTLSDNGHNDLAYKLLLRDTFPSWGYSIARGATTIWERWDGYTEEKGFQTTAMNSFTTARISLPAQDAARIKESGIAASQAPGVKLARMENGVAVFDVGAGNYQFVVAK